MRISATTLAAALACACGVATTPAGAVSVGQIDTFSGSLQGWSVGSGGAPSPVVVNGGGPGGAGDSYMQLSSTKSDHFGSKLVVINGSQWAGNYTASGVTRIEMDLRNLGSTDLNMRLLFEDPVGGGLPKNQAFTTVGIALAAGSGWTHVSFDIAASDLKAQFGSAAAALSNATQIRLYNGNALSYPGEAITAKLGVDNIAAVPEPASWALMLGGLGLVGGLARGSARRPYRRSAQD